MVKKTSRRAGKVEVPGDLAIALRRARGARAAFAGLAPSHQLEFISWIESAKKPETRQRRIEKAITMVLEKANAKG